MALTALAACACAGAPAPAERAPAHPRAPAFAVDLGARGASFDRAGWRTDFTRRSVPLREIHRGGPRRDEIAPIDRPRAMSLRRAARRLSAREPVIAVRNGRAVRAYRVRTLVLHEVVNDRLGGRPIAVTYSPLTNSSSVFDRRFDGRELRLGTTGSLRRSNPLLWDRATESWWQQMTGEAVVGALAGRRLRPLTAQTLSFAVFRRRYPRGDVLTRAQGRTANVPPNPYLGYDRPRSRPHLFRGHLDERLPPKERVLLLPGARPPVAVPFERLARRPVTHLALGGTPVVLLYRRGVASAIDADSAARSRDVGATGAFEARVGTRALSFGRRHGAFVDRETGSRWDVTGRAVGGRLRGARLRPLRHDEPFWFAAAALMPDVRVMAAPASHAHPAAPARSARRASRRGGESRPPRRATPGASRATR